MDDTLWNSVGMVDPSNQYNDFDENFRKEMGILTGVDTAPISGSEERFTVALGDGSKINKVLPKEATESLEDTIRDTCTSVFTEKDTVTGAPLFVYSSGHQEILSWEQKLEWFSPNYLNTDQDEPKPGQPNCEPTLEIANDKHPQAPVERKEYRLVREAEKVGPSYKLWMQAKQGRTNVRRAVPLFSSNEDFRQGEGIDLKALLNGEDPVQHDYRTYRMQLGKLGILTGMFETMEELAAGDYLLPQENKEKTRLQPQFLDLLGQPLLCGYDDEDRLQVLGVDRTLSRLYRIPSTEFEVRFPPSVEDHQELYDIMLETSLSELRERFNPYNLFDGHDSVETKQVMHDD